ncbi:MAG: aminotransferase class V-fold PLP-dependent enzyme, partial [Planctomycetes bacterium]|nr:aminotransferase class V-fold PLP-dependent enzyme [Planctomycetota bacterium]
MKAFLGAKYCYLVSSGTAALYIILRSLKLDTPRNEVIIPAYTCPSVAAAIVKAGLKIRLCDVNKNNFNYDIESLKNIISSDTLCIVTVHLFGIYTDVQALKDLCVQKNIYLIEDAAQGFGNYVENPDGNKMLGTLGDVGFYSFGRGKPLNLMHGGAIVTNSEKIANKIKWVYAQLLEPSFLTDIIVILKTFLYRLFFHRGLYWIPNSIPFLKLGETIFSLSFSITRMS